MSLTRALKRRVILNYLERKKKTEPFDTYVSETWSLPGDADINMNNSHFFTAAGIAGESLSMRLGMRNGSDWEIFVLYRNGTRFLVQEKECYPSAEAPVRFTMIEAGKKWRIEFSGRLKDSVSGELSEACAELVFEASMPIYDFMYHADVFNGMADSIAREKWNRSFFKEIGKNNQRHYEQTGHLLGTLSIDGTCVPIDLPCVRDHSFGRREWDMMNDHLWCLGLTEKGEALCFSIVNYPAMKRIYSGYTNIGSPVNLTLRDCEVTAYDPDGGKGGNILEFICCFSGGCRHKVRISREANVTCPLGGGAFVFQEGLGSFEIDGIKARGTMEYGFNGNPDRWEGFSRLK